ncbi:MAG: DUF5681 domain-containing protein [Pseudoxanthomonas sp.]
MACTRSGFERNLSEQTRSSLIAFSGVLIRRSERVGPGCLVDKFCSDLPITAAWIKLEDSAHKPPEETQFKKGTSKNPKGRSRGRKNLNSMITQLLTQRLKLWMHEAERNT